MKKKSVVLIGGDHDGMIYTPQQGINTLVTVNIIGGFDSPGKPTAIFEPVEYKADPEDRSRWLMSSHVIYPLGLDD